MALITCKFCGKQISSTAEKCIHCGAAVKDTNQDTAPTDTESPKNAPTQKKRIINELTPDLESEFLKTNKEARKYKMSINCFEIFTDCTYIILANAIILVMLYMILFVPVSDTITAFLDTHQICINNRLFFALTKKWSFIVLAVLILNIIGMIAFRLKKTYRKKLIYNKMIQKWLLSEKNIAYIPIFTSEKSKKEFDNIDLDISKL